MEELTNMSTGKVIQVIGPVVDVEFSLDDKLPEINTALNIHVTDDQILVVEVALDLGCLLYTSDAADE